MIENKLNIDDKLNTALLVFSKKEGFLSINNSAQRMLGLDLSLLNAQLNSTDHPNLKSFLNIISKLKSGDFDLDLSELENSIRHFRLEIKIDNQYFNLYISPLETNSYIIELSQIIYQDMNQSTHELKRPIQNIKTLVETLILGAKDDQIKLNEYLVKLNFEADRLGSLVSDMLSLSHIINGVTDLHKSELDLNQIVDKSFERASGRAEAMKVELINEIDSGFKVEADLKLLEHLLSNFIDNAIKYNNQNGKVYLRNDASSFRIDDTGFGISEEDKARVFEQFYRIKESAHIQGSGLGLSIVKGIADLHGWTIEIESELGKGTSFIIRTK
jgi:signal transduction histidine kinase